MPAMLGGLWTTVANARLLQQMRESANGESTLPPLDRLVAGVRKSATVNLDHSGTSMPSRASNVAASWASCMHVMEVPPVLPGSEHTPVVLVHTRETDSPPKTPNRPLVPILRHSEDPVLPTAPPLKPHHRGPPLQGCLKGTPTIGCRGSDRIETLQTGADCGGCGMPWARRTSRGATMRAPCVLDRWDPTEKLRM